MAKAHPPVLSLNLPRPLSQAALVMSQGSLWAVQSWEPVFGGGSKPQAMLPTTTVSRCFWVPIANQQGSPGSSAGKESTCNAGDPGLIPGLGRSLGKGIGYPLQYSWAFLVAQMVKNPPAMWETWVQSLGGEDWGAWQEGMAAHSSTLAWRIPTDRGAWWATVHGVTKCQRRLSE